MEVRGAARQVWCSLGRPSYEAIARTGGAGTAAGREESRGPSATAAPRADDGGEQGGGAAGGATAAPPGCREVRGGGAGGPADRRLPGRAPGIRTLASEGGPAGGEG